MDEKVEDIGPIEFKKVEEVKKTPYPLLKGFEWHALDLTKSTEVDALYKLLSDHYVEDDDNMFRFNYSRDFLKWALMPPGFRQDWHLAVESQKQKSLWLV
eukprot:UN06586